MLRIKTLLIGATGFAALAAAAPSTAQYYGYRSYSSPYGYNSYGYNNYGYNNYGYGVNTSMATQQCEAAVQNRLYNRTSLAGILGSLVGVPQNTGRVVSVTQVYPRSNGTVRVEGLASSGRYAYNNYGPYGMGAYGALGYGYANQADLSFACSVDPRGYVINTSIRRRY
jgi:hypothetical protein